jgi:hypothetical protein
MKTTKTKKETKGSLKKSKSKLLKPRENTVTVNDFESDFEGDYAYDESELTYLNDKITDEDDFEIDGEYAGL